MLYGKQRKCFLKDKGTVRQAVFMISRSGRHGLRNSMQHPPLEHRACDRDGRSGGRFGRKSAVFFLSLQTACSQEDTVKDVKGA